MEVRLRKGKQIQHDHLDEDVSTTLYTCYQENMAIINALYGSRTVRASYLNEIDGVQAEGGVY